MTQLFDIAARVSTPLALAGLALTAFFFVLRQLIRTHKFPMFTRQQSTEVTKHIIDRLFFLSLTATILGFIGFIATLVYGAEPARTGIAVDELSVRPIRYGYRWLIQISNPHSRIAVIDEINLLVVSKGRHPETDRRESPAGTVSREELAEVYIEPNDSGVSIVEPGRYAFPENDIQNFTFDLYARHAVHEGWIYDVRLAVKWHIPGSEQVQTTLGSVYRIGWPGMEGPLTAHDTVMPSNDLMVDPVLRVEG